MMLHSPNILSNTHTLKTPYFKRILLWALVFSFALLSASFESLSVTHGHSMAAIEIEIPEFDDEESKFSFSRQDTLPFALSTSPLCLAISQAFHKPSYHPKLSTGPPLYS